MIILDEHLKLNEEDTLSHRRYAFSLDKTYKSIKITLNYNPTMSLRIMGKNVLRNV